jgi:hypothetical protein
MLEYTHPRARAITEAERVALCERREAPGDCQVWIGAYNGKELNTCYNTLGLIPAVAVTRHRTATAVSSSRWSSSPAAPGDAPGRDGPDDGGGRRDGATTPGFMTTASDRRRAQAVSRREEELADGFAEMRWASFVKVSARDAEALERANGEAQHAGQLACLEFQRMYGERETAFANTLPLCRGLS